MIFIQFYLVDLRFWEKAATSDLSSENHISLQKLRIFLILSKPKVSNLFVPSESYFYKMKTEESYLFVTFILNKMNFVLPDQA